jgi:hypothetical protein
LHSTIANFQKYVGVATDVGGVTAIWIFAVMPHFGEIRDKCMKYF